METDITKYVSKESPVVSAIYAWHKEVGDAESKRGYLGASIIGHACDRYLWYCFRQCCREEIPGRIYRLFETGDLAEIRFIKELRAIGIEVHDVDANGDQFAISAVGGHFGGHMDGALLGVHGAEATWHVLEAKTYKDKSFVKLKREGVQKSKPVHFAQMQIYMCGTGMKRALYLAENKDTDELYAERIRHDKDFCEKTMERAEYIITSMEPPERAFNRPDYFECKWCSAKGICWATGIPSVLPIVSVSCRQCCHATPKMDGDARWECERHKRSLTAADQDKACEDHLVLPELVSCARPSDHGKNEDGSAWVEYTCEDITWRNGKSAGEFSTDEMRKLPVASLHKESFVSGAKEICNATVETVDSGEVLKHYQHCKATWTGKMSELAEAWKRIYGEDMSKLKHIATEDGFDYKAVEYTFPDGEIGRLAVAWLKTSEGQIFENTGDKIPF